MENNEDKAIQEEIIDNLVRKIQNWRNGLIRSEK